MDSDTLEVLAATSRGWRVQTSCDLLVSDGVGWVPVDVTAMDWNGELERVPPRTIRTLYSAPDFGQLLLLGNASRMRTWIDLEFTLTGLRSELQRLEVPGARELLHQTGNLSHPLWEEFPLPVFGSPPSAWSTLKDLASTGSVVGSTAYHSWAQGVETPGILLIAGGALFFVEVLIPAAKEMLLPAAGAVGETLEERIRRGRTKKAARKAPAPKKATAKKASTKKAPIKKAPTKKAPTKKAPARKTAGRRKKKADDD